MMTKKTLAFCFSLISLAAMAAEDIQINPSRGEYPGAKEPVPAIRSKEAPPAGKAKTPLPKAPLAVQEPAAPPAPPADPLLSEGNRDLENGDWKMARRKAKRYLASEKKSPEAWVLLGRTYMSAKKYGYALRRFKRALKYNPHYAPAFYWRGRAYEDMSQWDEAANEYQAALKGEPELPEARTAWDRLKSRASTPAE